MAVSINTPSTANLRSDYMISDAAMAGRNMEAATTAANDQSSKFEEMLSKADSKAEKFKDIKEAYDNGKYDVPSREELAGAGVMSVENSQSARLPDDPKELAKYIVSGKVKIKDIPAELLTPQLLIEIECLKMSGFKEDDEEEGEEIFAPAEDSIKTDLSKQLQNSDILAELAQLMRVMAGENADVSSDEELTEEETFAVLAVGEEAPVQNVVSEIISDNDAKSEFAAAETAVLQAENASEDNSEAKKAEAKPEAGRFDEFAASERKEVSEYVDKNSESGEMSRDKSGSEDLENLGAEKLEALNKAAENGEIKVLYAGKKEDAPETEVKNLEVPAVEEKTEAPEPREQAQRPKSDNEKSVGEELEMLKNAKQQKAEPAAAAVTTDNTAPSNEPIILRRADREISVRPSDVAAQVQKAVEDAIAVNKEQTEYSLVLNPEELGRITVKLIKAADGAVSVTVAAESARTQRILEQHSELMQSNLKNDGINLESWQTVRESQQDMHADDYNGSDKKQYQQAQNDNSDDAGEGQSFAEIIAAM